MAHQDMQMKVVGTGLLLFGDLLINGTENSPSAQAQQGFQSYLIGRGEKKKS